MPVQKSRSVQGIFSAVVFRLCCLWITKIVFTPNGVAGEELAHTLASQPTDIKCDKFSKGWSQNEDHGEFFSPNYPNNYFNSTECSLTIIAPSNHLIELDFREVFEIESSSECVNDYLEIFDGLGGHRQRLARLCGMEYPKDKIYSSGRFLYLRFKSDETAEYRGFKGVYFFKRRPDKVLPLSESCEHKETNFEGIFGTTDFSDAFTQYSVHGNTINCLWVINVTKNYKVSLYFWEFQLSFPNKCEKNFIRIYEKQLDDNHLKEELCGTQAKNASFKDPPIYIYMFETPDPGTFSKFKIHYTIYRPLESNQDCPEGEFDCQDMSCIDKSLVCNGRQNCKYLTDEEKCQITAEEASLLKEKVMVILIIGILLLLSLGVAMVISCRRQWKDLNKRREELTSRFCGLDNLVSGPPDVPDDEGCYVPEVDLSIFNKRSNGGNAVVFEQETPHDRIDQFHQRGDSHSTDTSTPPPPPPPLYRNDTDGVLSNQSQIINSSTLDEEVEEAADVFPPTSSRQPVFDNRRFRAKAIIQADGDRPQSFESTKSAPDVIGRH